MKKLILLSLTCLSTFIINAQCSADFTWTTSGNSVQLTNTSSGTYIHDWSFGDGNSSSATNPTHTYASPGNYDICLYSYYIDSLGGFCDDSVCYQVTVMDSSGGTSCNADFTWNVSGNTVSFTNTSTGTNSNDWWFGDGTSSTAVSPTHTFGISGTYTVCLYSYYMDSIGGFCDDSVCYNITVFDSTGGTSCNADFTWSVSGNTVQLTNTSIGTSNHDWWFGDGTSSTDTNPVHTFATSGTYTICLYSYYLDSIGGFCDDSICYDVMVFDSLDSTAGTATLSFKEFSLFPNPANSTLNIQLDLLPSNSHALIVDMLGREMVEVNLTSQITEVQVDEFPKGIYLVQLFDSNDQLIGLSKFVRE